MTQRNSEERTEGRRHKALAHAIDLAKSGYLGLTRDVTAADIVSAAETFSAFLAGEPAKKGRR